MTLSNSSPPYLDVGDLGDAGDPEEYVGICAQGGVGLVLTGETGPKVRENFCCMWIDDSIPSSQPFIFALVSNKRRIALVFPLSSVRASCNALASFPPFGNVITVRESISMLPSNFDVTLFD
jgi:hypothetical protein